jgi:hypothetical protein
MGGITMKFSNFVNSLFGWSVAGLGLLAIFVLGGCFVTGGGTVTPATTGNLSVSLGFGAVTTSGYQCTGGGTVTISSASGAIPSQNYSFSGISSNTSPACSAAVMFSNLQPGTWTIQVSPIGVTCQKQVTAGQFTTATIRVDVGTCQ